MARYIDADALIAKGWRLERHAPSGAIISEMSIADVPTADVAEVVRCKYCEHYEADIICEGVGYCNEHQRGMRENNFCSYGERRKDDGE